MIICVFVRVFICMCHIYAQTSTNNHIYWIGFSLFVPRKLFSRHNIIFHISNGNRSDTKHTSQNKKWNTQRNIEHFQLRIQLSCVVLRPTVPVTIKKITNIKNRLFYEICMVSEIEIYCGFVAKRVSGILCSKIWFENLNFQFCKWKKCCPANCQRKTVTESEVF